MLFFTVRTLIYLEFIFLYVIREISKYLKVNNSENTTYQKHGLRRQSREIKAVGVHKTEANAAQRENPRDVQNTQVFSNTVHVSE